MLIYWYLAIWALILIVVAVCFFLMRRYYIRLLRYEVVRARRSEHIKTVFLANVSHALRNPLHSIITTSDEMLSIGIDDMKPQQISDAITQINKDGNQLMYFISQLIELSNIESNVMTFTLIEVNLAELMQSYRREAQRDAADGVSVVVRSRLSPHCKGTLDTTLMYQLMKHLLQGAVRHTTEGTITINYEHERQGLRVTVTDTGTGLSPECQNIAASVLNDNESLNLFRQSSGLGLSICKAIVDGMSGEMSLDSTPGKGTTVTIYFPCKLRDKNKLP
jgi:signal transduction histidine kinase